MLLGAIASTEAVLHNSAYAWRQGGEKRGTLHARGKMPVREIHMMRLDCPSFLAVFLLCACGSNASSPATSEDEEPGSDMSCASGEVYCTGCNSGGFCTAKCPAVACPVLSDAGGSSGASGSSSGMGASADDAAATSDANTVGGNSCPTGTP
ncbi:MAG: hypothetical protein M3O46_11820, partial [Myxococcota bacterium]|nr:hypothetical protein [Myxococcota bacterium]